MTAAGRTITTSGIITEIKMKTRISILASVLLLSAAALTSCSDADEVVPITESNTTTRTYKVADPVLLNSAEQTQVAAIRNEYYDNVEQ
jgi:hypothetical protein